MFFEQAPAFPLVIVKMAPSTKDKIITTAMVIRASS